MEHLLNIKRHRQVQHIAKKVLDELLMRISEDDTEYSIAEKATALLLAKGIRDTWYYDCPALVLLGSRSCLSISGRAYVPGRREQVGKNNLVTVDLSPSIDNVWGDCARSFYIEDGHCRSMPHTYAFSVGAMFLGRLHKSLLDFATPATTFEELYRFGNTQIEAAGFQNLDFRKNLGHSIASRTKDRCFIEDGNTRCLGEIALFTFEPHIRLKEGSWGFKHENIYFFDQNGHLEEL